MAKESPSYLHPLRIGPIELANNLALAPMAGTTDLVYRVICHELGAGLVVTELVSARGICHDPDLSRSWRYLEIDPAREGPVAIQLFGADPADFAMAIERIHRDPLLGQCSMIDLNMGCPVTKVTRGGEGSALMKDLPLAGRIIEACVRTLERIATAGADVAVPTSNGSAAKPVTVKFRKGWDEQSINAVDFARLCETSGAAAIAVHARTRDQYYSGQADWSVIGDVKQAVRIPVYGNGDINSPDAARRLIDQTGVDGLMIGRAALGNPWIFAQLTSSLAVPADLVDKTVSLWQKPGRPEQAALIVRQARELTDRLREGTAIPEMRKQLAAYLRGSRDAAHWKNLAMQAKSLAEVQAVLEQWAQD